jgi:YgiT-type zinc finger domain-containing protein
MKCMCCQGKMEKSTAPFSISRKGYHIHWDAIPTYVCSQCGEIYFEAEEVDKIRSALVALEKENQGLINV